MSTEVRWRRGTDAQHAAFIGAMSEITHDTTNNNLRVHDGVTEGGHATLMAREKGAAGGVATLDEGGLVPESQLGNVPVPDKSDYGSITAVETAEIKEDVQYLRTAGYYAPGDGGGALYKRVATQPAHAGKVQSADGAWWELCEVSPNVRQFGAKGDNVTDDTQAFSDALKYCEDKALLYGGAASLRAPQGQYRTTGVEYNADVYMPIKIYGDGPDATIIRGMVGSTSPILRVNAAAPSFFQGHIEIADMTLDGDGHGASAGLEMNEVWYSVLRNVRAINCVRGYNLLTCIYVDIYSPDLHWNVVGMNIDKLVTSSFPDALPAVINVFGGLIRINSRIGIYADYMNSLTLYGTGIEYNGTLVGDAGHGGVIIGSNIDRSGKATGLSWYGGWIEGNKGDAGVQLYSGVNAIRDVRGWEPSGDTTYSIHIRGGQYTLDNLTTTGGSIKEEAGVSTGNRIACCYNFTKDIDDNKTGVDEGASLKKAYITVGGPDMASPSLVLQNGQVYFQFVLEGTKLKLKIGNTELDSWG